MREILKPLKVAPRFELGNGSFAGFCLTTWLCHRNLKRLYVRRDNGQEFESEGGGLRQVI